MASSHQSDVKTALWRTCAISRSKANRVLAPSAPLPLRHVRSYHACVTVNNVQHPTSQESELLEVVRKPKYTRATSSDILPTSLPSTILRKNDFQSSTKLDALLRSLRALRDQDPGFRAVVFSQWTSFLDLIAQALDREPFAWCRLDGSMTQPHRSRAIEEFMKPGQQPKVFIVVSASFWMFCIILSDCL